MLSIIATVLGPPMHVLYHLSMLVLCESNRASAIERMLYYYRHISIFMFFPVQYLCVPCHCHACLSLLRYAWE